MARNRIGIGRGVLKTPVAISPPKVHLQEGAAPLATNRDIREVEGELATLRRKSNTCAESVSLPTISANSTQTVDVTCSREGLVRMGDAVIYGGSDEALTHGLRVSGCAPAPADNTIRFFLANLTAAPPAASTRTLYFLVSRP